MSRSFVFTTSKWSETRFKMSFFCWSHLIKSRNNALQMCLKNCAIVTELNDAVFLQNVLIISLFSLFVMFFSVNFKISKWLRSDEFIVIHITFMSRFTKSFLIFFLWRSLAKYDNETNRSIIFIWFSNFSMIELLINWRCAVNWIARCRFFTVSSSIFFWTLRQFFF